MLKVLFADDEPLMLEGLRYLVDWNTLGFEICGEALDGEDAERLIQARRPDLVITDVRMPVIDGLDLIERFSESDSRPKFIIFSGYADFDYARRALKYGVSNYLTKPLDETELIRAVQAVVSDISAARERFKRQSALSAMVLSERVTRILMRMDTRTEIEGALGSLGINPDSRFCCVLIHGITEVMPSFPDTPQPHIEDNIAGSSIQAFPFEAGIGKQGFLLVSPAKERTSHRMAERWINEVRGRYPRSVTYSVSSEQTGAGRLHTAYQEALKAELCRPHTDQRSIRQYAKQSEDQLAELPADLKKSIHQAVTEGDVKHLQVQLKSVFHFFADITSKAWIEAYLTNIKTNLLREIAAKGGDAAGWEEKWFARKADTCLLPQLEQQTLAELSEAAEWFAEADPGLDDPVVAAAVGYIETHYGEKLKLQDIARQLHINSAYLGQRIKKLTGKSFNELLHSIRIEQAKKLLRRTELPIYDVAQLVGYSDADLFTSRFKSLNGISPSVYKKG